MAAPGSDLIFAVTARIDGVVLRNDANDWVEEECFRPANSTSVYLGILSAGHCQQAFEEILSSVNPIFQSLDLRIG